ncbi:leucine zipper protein 2 isoform X2 [Tachyglossus aculeatus]|uniref:leucine zipper protein 2 isoform X2 n=1 Tax=Tachyglossus aculeatus TaxID=9261 RepID=UPI0018F4A3E5|nr:leucine zipper protein 2 isoform X2 [Tachyglossus aculeatus]
MKFISAYYLLPLFPALILSTRQGYEELERQLKEVFKERSNILRQLSKTSKELDGIKVNLESLKNDEASAKNDVKKLLELGQKQREEMKSLQEAFQKQLNEATEKAEKQQATINFLKTEVERKSKMIRDLQNENKSLKNKLLSGSKLCGIHAEEAQQLTDLEQKLAIAKDELEKAALDEESQLKALKETVQLCLSSVLHNQSPVTRIISSNPTERRTSPSTNDSRVPVQVSNTEPQQSASENKGTLEEETTKEENPTTHKCDSQDAGKACLVNHRSSSPSNKTTEGDPTLKKLNIPPWIKPEPKKITEKNLKNLQEIANTKEKAL